MQSSIDCPVQAERTGGKLPFRWQANRATFDALAIVVGRYGGGVKGRTANVV